MNSLFRYTYLGLFISLSLLLILMMPQYSTEKNNLIYEFSNIKGTKFITLDRYDIYKSDRLTYLDAKHGDIAAIAPGKSGYYTPKEQKKDRQKLIRIAQNYNLKSISIAFLLIAAAYYLSKSKASLFKILIGLIIHLSLIVIPVIIYDDISIQGKYFITYYSITFFTILSIIYYIFYIVTPYIGTTYSNSLLGLYIQAKKGKLRKELEKEINDNKK